MEDQQQHTKIVTDSRFTFGRMVLLVFVCAVVVPFALFVGCVALGLGATVVAN